MIVRYLRLLSYDNACKVVDYVNKKGKEHQALCRQYSERNNYAHITVGGVTLQLEESSLDDVMNFVKELNVRYELTEEHPTTVTQQIIKNLKEQNIID